MPALSMSVVSVEVGDAAGAIRQEIRRLALGAKPAVRQRVGDVVEKAIRNRKETLSLLDGGGDTVTLREHLGLRDPVTAVEKIIATIRQSMLVEYVDGSGDLLGTFKVSVLRSDFEDVLVLDVASYVNEGRAGGVIAWLSWLLFRGSDMIILGSKLRAKDPVSASRTGRAIMATPNPARRKGAEGALPASWGIPPEYSGREEDNFLTRAMDDAAEGVNEALVQELTRALNG